MNATIYFLISLSLLIIYLIISKGKQKKEIKLRENKENEQSKSLDANEKKGLVLGAIMFLSSNEIILNINPEKSLNYYRNQLQDQWEITSSREAKNILNSLLLLEKSKELDFYLNEKSEMLYAIKKAVALGLNIDLMYVKETQSTFAWDIARTVFLARWCFWSGFLTEIETLEYINQARKKASLLGKNWTDYTVSFLLGRTIQGFDLAEVIDLANQLLNYKETDKGANSIDFYSQYPY